jgi:hypothetical protein
LAVKIRKPWGDIEGESLLKLNKMRAAATTTTWS